MPEAQSLRELLIIRHANRKKIDAVNGNLGSALGFKDASDPNNPDNGKPAIIVFVANKIAPKWLAPSKLLPKHFKGPGGLTCPVDVVEVSDDYDYPLLYDDGHLKQEVVYARDLFPKEPLSEAQLALLDRLRGWNDEILPGSQISFEFQENDEWKSGTGTIACFARSRSNGELGLLTNRHVSGPKGTPLYFPTFDGVKIATTKRSENEVRDQDRFAGIIDEDDAHYLIDCGFAKLSSSLAPSDIEMRVPYLENNQPKLLSMGPPLPLDLDTMGPIGQKVFGVGRTLSLQKGKIAAFAYEYDDGDAVSRYTDYLISGTDPHQFSAPGGSGKLILTDEENPRPVALLWGGVKEKLSNRKGLRDWTLAIDINYVLDRLNIEIAR